MKTPSIKKQALDKILKNLEALKSENNPTPDGKVRTVTRELDMLKSSEHMPSLMVYDGEELIIDEDERGITFQFPLTIKLQFSSPRDLAEIKDVLVPAVQTVMESDLQLGGLVNWVKGGEEQPFIAEIGKPLGGALLHYQIEYRRMRGNPYKSY